MSHLQKKDVVYYIPSTSTRSVYLALLVILSAAYNIYVYYINTSEIPSELSRENFISSHVKKTCYLHM